MKIFLILFLMLVPFFCLSQKIREGTFSELETVSKKISKPVIIHLYTEWCSVCKIEGFRLNKDKELVGLINDKFYFINFETEKTREKIRFGGKEFKYLPNGSSGIHELAMALSRNKNQPVYPLWLILDADQNLVYYHEGIFQAEKMKQKLREILAFSGKPVLSQKE